MNKYFKNEKFIKELEKDLKISLSEVKDLEEHIQSLKDECNHTYENEKTSIVRVENTGPGGTVYHCNICGKTGNWLWAGKHL
jgi:hypothetical protein